MKEPWGDAQGQGVEVPGFFMRMEEQTETQSGLRARNQNLGEDDEAATPVPLI